MFAALKNKGNIVNFLLDFLPKKKLTIDSRDNYGQLPLVMLAAEDNLPMVEFLLEKNANINSTNSRNFTAVMGAAELGHLDVIKSLIERGAEMELKNDKGATALALATESGHGAIVEYLAAKGADINALDSDGRTPLMIAILKDHTDIAEFLLRQENCTIDVKDNWGWTALELAAECGHQKIVELLLNKEADVNSQDADGYTPLMYAILRNLGNIPENKIKEIYPRLLESNLGWKETNSATLGLQQYSEKVLLVQNIPMEACDYTHFNKHLESFVNTFEYWIKNLQDLQVSQPSHQPAKSKNPEIRV